MTDTSKNELVPAPTLARELGIHRRSLARWLDDERLALPRPTKIRQRLFFSREEIEKWKSSACAPLSAWRPLEACPTQR